MQVLENDRFCVTVNEFGAELSSFVSRRDGTEYLWQADATFWKRHAPLLFPIVGRLKDKTYTVGGKTYTITQHGFARDLPFTVEQSRKDMLLLSLRQNEYTKKMYPWDFTLQVCYTLTGSTLRKEHVMRNDSDTPLWYEVGGHDAYNLCLEADETVGDSYIQFEDETELHPIITDDAVMLSRLSGTTPLKKGRLYLSAKTFCHDALILEGLKHRRVSLCSDRNARRVTMDFPDFPYFALWSIYKGTEVPYVCLEPWSTLPDGDYLDHAIENKIGVRTLAPGEQETLTFSVTISE